MLDIPHVEIEIPAEEAGSGQRLAAIGLGMNGTRGQGIGRGFFLQVQQPHDLDLALGGGMKFQMRVDDPDRTERGPNRDIQRHAPHAARHAGARPRQQMTGDLQHRQPRQRHVAETMRPALAVDGLDRRAEIPADGPAATQQAARFDRCRRRARQNCPTLPESRTRRRRRVDFATDTIRARSVTPSQPLPHWMFQVTSRISECPPA